MGFYLTQTSIPIVNKFSVFSFSMSLNLSMTCGFWRNRTFNYRGYRVSHYLDDFKET